MSEQMTKETILALLRIDALSNGGDICDRCNGVIWPELELVRCDFCCGKYGPPERERIQEAAVKHRERIRRCEREAREDYYRDLEETAALEAENKGEKV